MNRITKAILNIHSPLLPFKSSRLNLCSSHDTSHHLVTYLHLFLQTPAVLWASVTEPVFESGLIYCINSKADAIFLLAEWSWKCRSGYQSSYHAPEDPGTIKSCFSIFSLSWVLAIILYSSTAKNKLCTEAEWKTRLQKAPQIQTLLKTLFCPAPCMQLKVENMLGFYKTISSMVFF